MASKSLGTLTLDLVAKTGGFVQGMDKAERSSAKWRKQVEKDAKTIGTALGAGSAAALAGLVAMTASTVKSATEVSRFAAISGAGAEEFQRYAAAADMVGISQEKLSDQLKDFNEKVGEFQQSGGGGMKDFFEQIAPQIGITAEAFRDLSGPQALQLYYDSLEKAGLNQKQMSFYLESMASDTTALIPLLRDGGAGFKLLGDEAERAGAILNEDTIGAADRMSAAIFVAENAMKGFRNDISSKLLPVLGDLAVEFSDVATEGAIAEDVGSVLASTTKGLAAAAVGAFAALQLLGRGIAGVAVVGDKLTETEWYEKIIPPLLYRRIYKNWDEAKQAIGVVGEDLDETTQRYAKMLDGIWNAGDGGGEASSTIDRIAKLREEMRTLEKSSPGSGVNPVMAEDAKKAAEAIQKQIDALQLKADTVAMSAEQESLYKLQMDGATEAQLRQAEAALQAVSAYEKQAEAVRAMNEAQEETNRETISIMDSLLSEEEQIKQSYERRRQIILDNTLVTGEAQGELLRQLEEKKNEDLLEINGSYWERYLLAAEENLQSFDELSGVMLENFTGRFGDAFESMVFDAESLGDSVRGLAEGMARSIVNALGQMAAQWVAYQAVQMLVGKTTQASAANTLTFNALASQQMAAINAFASTAAIPIVGPLMAPAASAAAIAATSPMVGAVASLSLAGMAHEGIDSIPQTGTWLLEKGERVTTAETSAKLDKTLSDIEQGGSGAPIVNLYEDSAKAGQVNSRQEDGKNVIDIFVADIMSDGKSSKAISRAFGVQRSGT
ncbi:phage tail tape measure protein [Stutzerimonas stutzeri]|uniref:phage tail tape measure protein n=1 Tax=Stutzerimonas stutzeri TaxID=316 RepID=UPI003717A1B8